MIIEKLISNEEILVRYIFLDNFKKKIVSIDKIISKDLLNPLRGGTSLQREKYCDENQCLKFGNKIDSKKLVGFLLFTKSTFESVKNKFVESSVNKESENKILDAYIKATPLNSNGEELCFEDQAITMITEGNPAHADIIYLKPEFSSPDDEGYYVKPNPTIRSFSKQIFLLSKVVLLTDSDKYTVDSFKSYMSNIS